MKIICLYRRAKPANTNSTFMHKEQTITIMPVNGTDIDEKFVPKR